VYQPNPSPKRWNPTDQEVLIRHGRTAVTRTGATDGKGPASAAALAIMTAAFTFMRAVGLVAIR